MASERHVSGLWAALFIILLLPFLFLRQGGESLLLNAPALGLPASLPRADVVWEYQGGPQEAPLWLGGPLLGCQIVLRESAGTLVAVSVEGSALWREEAGAGPPAVTGGREVLFAAPGGGVVKRGGKNGVSWADHSDWPVQLLTLAPDGRAAVVEGPLAEGSANLMERVRLYAPDGSMLGEYVLRNASALKIEPAGEGWFLSTIGLSSTPRGARLLALTREGRSARTLWEQEEVIQAVAHHPAGMAAASGRRLKFFPQVGTGWEVELANPVSHLAFTADGCLLAVEAGGSGAAPARLTLLTSQGKKAWQRRLRGPCRGLFSRGGTVLVADTRLVYALDGEGRLQWCYEAPAPIAGFAPLAAGDEVVVATEGQRLILITPPAAGG